MTTIDPPVFLSLSLSLLLFLLLHLTSEITIYNHYLESLIHYMYMRHASICIPMESSYSFNVAKQVRDILFS